ncbi:MAG: hypothetical protein U5L00_02235 [Desulfovermiculus sp.]|nr:hypothetical protein [Desulfovermiculus sp.]
MSIRSVRLDNETEEILQSILSRKQMTFTQAVKEGIRSLAQSMGLDAGKSPYEIFKSLDLGSGGATRVSSDQAKEGIGKILREGHDSC